jgi:hypothetical protein
MRNNTIQRSMFKSAIDAHCIEFKAYSGQYYLKSNGYSRVNMVDILCSHV